MKQSLGNISPHIHWLLIMFHNCQYSVLPINPAPFFSLLRFFFKCFIFVFISVILLPVLILILPTGTYRILPYTGTGISIFFETWGKIEELTFRCYDFLVLHFSCNGVQRGDEILFVCTECPVCCRIALPPVMQCRQVNILPSLTKIKRVRCYTVRSELSTQHLPYVKETLTFILYRVATIMLLSKKRQYRQNITGTLIIKLFSIGGV
jgi:hypothetical protein